MISRKVYIVGMGQTKRGFFPDQDWRALLFDAYSEAIQECKLDPKEIGHVWFGFYPATASHQFTASHSVVDALGLSTQVGCTVVEKACSSGGDAIHGGFVNIASGMDEVVLVAAAGKTADCLTGGFSALADENFMLAQVGIPAGLDRAVEGGGEAYLRRHVTEDDIYGLYYTWHWYATRHPNSMIYRQTFRTREEYDKIPYDVYPFRFGTAGSRFADGASAVLLASEEIARRVTGKPVELAAVVTLDDAQLPSARSQYNPWKGGLVPMVVSAWEKAYEMARVGPTDFDLFQPHDNSPMKAWKHLEHIGHPEIKVGQAPGWYREGNALPGGKLPSATAGICRGGYVEACNPIDQLIENVRQLNGQAGERQVSIRKGVAAGITSTLRTIVHIVKAWGKENA